jgi:hypothetical protein
MIENNITDVEYAAMIALIDNYIANMVEETKLPIPTVTSIILARLMVANDFGGSGDLFRDLMTQAMKMRFEKHPDLVKH